MHMSINRLALAIKILNKLQKVEQLMYLEIVMLEMGN